MKQLHTFDTVHDAQELYRKILHGTANPVSSFSIREFKEKMFGEFGSLLAIAFTLLDNEVTFYVVRNPELSEDIKMLTMSTPVEIENADCVFVCSEVEQQRLLESVKYGTLVEPHKNATLVFQLKTDDTTTLEFQGPGINGVIQKSVSSYVKEVLRARDALCLEYPCGVDLIFVDVNDDVISIPRLTKWREI